jgi:hypothetical protein
VEQFRQAYNDPRDSSNIDIIVSILRRFSNERKETVKQALRDVLKESLPFFIEISDATFLSIPAKRLLGMKK